METMNFTEAEKFELFALVFAILHLGNVTFVESKNDEAQVQVDASESSQIRIKSFFSFQVSIFFQVWITLRVCFVSIRNNCRKS